MQLSIQKIVDDLISEEQKDSLRNTSKPLQEIDYLCQPLPPAQPLTWEQQRLCELQKYQLRCAQELKNESQNTKDAKDANFLKGLLG